MNSYGRMSATMLLTALTIFLFGCKTETPYKILDNNKIATDYYKEDAEWYLENIPFFECSDKQIERAYYYRWQL